MRHGVLFALCLSVVAASAPQQEYGLLSLKTDSKERWALFDALKGRAPELVKAFAPHVYQNEKGERMPYRLFTPARVEPGRTYPLVVFLHGAAGSGTDNEKQLQGGNVYGALVWALAGNQAKHPAFVLAPQSDWNWPCTLFDPKNPPRIAADIKLCPPEAIGIGARLAFEVIDSLLATLPIDRTRIYVTGHSMGGAGTWHMIAHRPRFFAAAVPVCGRGIPELAPQMKDTPVWNFHGAKDDVEPVASSRGLIEAIRKAGGSPRHTEYADLGHTVFAWAYTEPALVEWLFAQRREPPVVIRKFDEPDAAAEYYAARRAPASATIDPRERYRTALGRLPKMPRFATAADRRLPSLADAGATFAPVAWMGVPNTAANPDAALLETWTPLGPGNIGGRMRTLTIDPQNPSRMYAGGVSGGVWRTDDAGASWRPVGDALANLAINAMAMSPRDPRIIYVGTGEGYFRETVRHTGLPLRGAGVFVTTDGGGTWSHLASTASADFHYVNDLVISPNDDRVLYAATRTGVWRSRDRGLTWSAILPVTVLGGCLDLAVRTDLPGDALFAACGTFEQATVYRTTDAAGAAVFAPVLSDPGMGRTTLAIAASDENVVYALAASNVPGPNGLYEQALHAVFRSGAGGAAGTWTAQVRNTDPSKLNTLILTNPIAASYRDCRFASADSYTPMGWYVASLAVDPADPQTVWAAGVDWFRSRDGGRTWGVVSEWWRSGVSAFVHADQHGLVFHPGYNGTTNQQAFALTDGGIYRTGNARGTDSRDPCTPAAIGVAWTSLNHNLGVTQFYHGLPFPDGLAYFGGTQDNGTIVGTAQTGTDGWRAMYGGDGAYVAIDPVSPNILYVQTQWANILRSDDWGQTFASATEGLDPRVGDNLRGERGSFLFITPIAADPQRSGILWTGGRYIYRRTPSASRETEIDRDSRRRSGGIPPDPREFEPGTGRETWRRASERLLGDGLVSAVAVASADSDRVAAGSTTGHVYVTTEGLARDAIRWDVARPREGWVTSVAHDPADPNVMYVTYGGFGASHVFKSTNGGRTWRAIDGAGDTAVPDVPVHVAVVDPSRPSRLYLGTDIGVFVSEAAGDVWAVENTGFGAIVTEWLAPLRTPAGEQWLFAFTHGRGAWKVRLR